MIRPLRRSAMSVALVLSVASALGGGVVLLGSADAASPSSGAVSDTAPTTSWTGGPFVAANVTGTAGDVDCSLPNSCDDYQLRVDAPAGYGADHQLKVDVSWANAAADFDVYLLDSAGNVIASAASSADPEQIIVPPNSGTYTVRVVPFAPLGETYTASATLAAAPANPPAGTDTRAGFANYPAPSSFADANDAGEPSIGVNTATGAAMYQAGLSTFRATFDGASPAQATWADVSANAANGCPVGSLTSLDPILYTDRETGRTFESQLITKPGALTCYTDDDGETWNVSQGAGANSGVDHQTLGGGHYSANGVGALPTSSYKNIVYYCSQDIATAYCSSSRDGGVTFGPAVPTYSLLDCGGLHGHIKVAPDGTAYLPNKGCGDSQAVVVSDDNGTSWDVRNVPGATPGDSDPSVGVGANGTVYFGYVGADGKPGVATSADGGKTWQHGQTVGGELGIQNAVFPAMVAGDDDRAAFAYLGTPTGGNYQDTANFTGVWHLYVTTTYDGGKTWQTSDATPSDPVQRGSICTGGTTCGDDRNLLDFMDVTIDDHGRVLVGYADGCIGECVTGGANNHDAYATIARQSSGKTLYSTFDPVSTNATLTSLTGQKTSKGFTATAVVTNTGTTTLDGVVVQVLDGRKQVLLSSGASVAPGRTLDVTATWSAGRGSHVVTAVADPANAIAEDDEGDNKQTATLTR